MTLDEKVAAQLGRMQLEILRLQTVIEALTEEKKALEEQLKEQT